MNKIEHMFATPSASTPGPSVSAPECYRPRSYALQMPTSLPAENAALLALLRTRPEGATWQYLTTEVLDCGSAQSVWESYTTPELLPDPARVSDLEQATTDLKQWQSRGLRFLSVLDPEYPRQLRDIHQVPPFLFAAGTLVHDDTAVSVVGSRKATERGLQITRTITSGLVDRGITVLSGLAEGIDAAAHNQALSSGGRTVAIIGTGITKYYPAANRALQDSIRSSGLVLSQFWPEASPTRYSFPMRNAVMSGYGIASIIVEASEHSGARIQARLAVEHGRPVVLTDAVVSATEWGRSLAEQPGVHVASSTAEVMGVIEEIQRRRDTLPELLSALAVTG